MMVEIDNLYRLSKEKERAILYALQDIERKLYTPELRYSFFIKGNDVRVVAYNIKSGRVVFEVIGDVKNLDVLEKKWKDEVDKFSGLEELDEERKKLIDLIIRHAYFPITDSYIQYLKKLDVEKLRNLYNQLTQSYVNRGRPI